MRTKRSYTCRGYGKKIKLKHIKPAFKIRKELSIIVPSYNEEGNIKKLVFAIKKMLNKTTYKGKYEIIVVDDESKDRTPGIIDNLAKNKNFIAVHRHGIKGIATAVLDGVNVANGKYVLTMDADFSHPPELIPEMLKNKETYDIIIASRYIKGGDMKASFTRKWGGFFLNRICGIIIGTKVRDLGGNFRLFKKSSFNRIKFRDGYMFAEFGQDIFSYADKFGLKIKEIPFVYIDRKEGQSKIGNFPLKQAIYYIKSALQLRFNTNSKTS